MNVNLLGGAIDTGLKILDKFVPDANERKKAHEELKQSIVTAANAANLAQIEVNRQEAAHPHIFVAGWRPFCGWVCGVALAYNFVVAHWMAYGLVLYDETITPPPLLQLEYLMTVLMGMLGLGAARTYERVNDKEKSHQGFRWRRRKNKSIEAFEPSIRD